MKDKFLFENEITLENREILEEYLNGFDYKTSGLSFSALYMWRNINRFSWQIIGEYMFISGISHLELDKEEFFVFPPLTRTGYYDSEKLAQSIMKTKDICESQGSRFSVRLMPFHMMDIIGKAFPGEFVFIDDRPNYDYVYKTQDLIDLKGRDYHSKKNHLNYFLNNFQYKYIPLTSSMADKAMQFIEEFNLRKKLPPHEMELLKLEEIAMQDVFQNIEKVGYLAGAIIIDGKIEALSLGGNLNKKTVTVHVEKANIEFRGLYQAINNEFCKSQASNVKYINREEDMGIPGLRKAKLSYKPYKLLEKYIAVFRNEYCS